ncbi:MAG: hypothetical protein ACRELE_03530 [Gemmatimonadales bacterium]
MNTDAIVELLSYASGNDRTVRIVLRDGTEVTGRPSSIDLHPTAFEVFLHPDGDDDTEIGVSIAAIVSAEMN